MAMSSEVHLIWILSWSRRLPSLSLAVMPSLTSLTLKLAQSTYLPPLLLWPRDLRRDVNISNLRQFTISYPHPDDEIFAHLPPELLSISVRDSPRYFIYNKCVMAPNRTPVLSGTDLLRILNTQAFIALERLEIVYRVDSGDPQMMESIADMFPELRFLEIHRYPSDDSEKSALKEIVTTLSRLKNLRVLRLNLHPTSHPPFEVILESLDVLGERAQIVADAFALSQLSEVAFLRRNYYHNYWATWYIDRDPHGGVTNVWYERKSTHYNEFYDEMGPVPRRRR
ncbi:hypothetical protein A0H81_12503 [Grifola frondosa]|uniref:F-box domain-containing protein n=1 Tax=Grifola frondosa TaxID=5627 RepID=A0A1C7LSV9_GRIFR|nr:hypothetical protein A0H81_12503 [Grifola frondosa]